MPITQWGQDWLAEHAAVECILSLDFDPAGTEPVRGAILAGCALEFETLESPDAVIPHPDHEPANPSA